jgi:hypothetical protein
MSETQPTASTSDLGVVDPIRIPGGARARGLWSGLPLLGQVFVVLVVLDVIVRALGLFRTSLFIELSAPLTWVTAFLPHDALVLLPAAILYRRPSALVEFPLLIRGAITVALVELLKDPVRGLLASAGEGDDLLRLVLLGVVAAIATALGWATMGRGLQAITPSKAWDSSALLANLVGGALAIAAIAAAVSALLFGNLDLGDNLTNLVARVTGTVTALSALGMAYLAWVVARGTDDPARPVIATRLATASFAGIAIGTFLSLVAGAGLFWILLLIICYAGGLTGLVVSFALGLADPSGTIERAVPTDDRATEQPAPA